MKWHVFVSLSVYMDLYTADFWFSSAVIAEKLPAVWCSFSCTTLWFFIHYNFHYLHNDAIEEAFGLELSNWPTLRESTLPLLVKFSRCVVSRAAGNTADTRFISWKQSKVVFVRKLNFESRSRTRKNFVIVTDNQSWELRLKIQLSFGSLNSYGWWS